MKQPRVNPPRTPLTFTQRDYDRADMAGLMVRLDGRRAVLVNEEGSHHDYRVVGELRSSALAVVVDVVRDEAWWRHKHLAMRMEPIRWPAAAVWVEM